MQNVLVVCNFKAGRKTAIKYKKKVIKFLLRQTKSFKFIEIEKLSDVDVAPFDTIIAMGGDGTVNKVLPYLIGSTKVLGIIPCGTANLLAAKLGISTNIKKALKVLKRNQIIPIDVMSVNDMPAILRCGLGYDANIICKTPQSLKNKFGYFSYFIAGILFAIRLKTNSYKIIFDGKKLLVNATCIIIANADNMYKNIVSVGNNSKLNDGFLDIFILKAKNPITFFIEFIKIILNKKTNNPLGLYFQTSSLKMSNTLTMLHIDGEKKKVWDEINVKIIPKSVNVYAKEIV